LGGSGAINGLYASENKEG